MGKLEYFCVICRNRADLNVCKSCQAKSRQPCPDCGTPTPTITRMGKKPKNPTCVACTTRRKAPTRRIGITCRVCKLRFKKVDRVQLVCPTCYGAKVQCPVCECHMPKYNKKAGVRKYCSSRCLKLANPTSPERFKQGQMKRWAGYVRKTHQNTLARRTVEYKQWRAAVFKRDNYTCQDCGDKFYKGCGRQIELHPHHIKPFAAYPDLRYDIDNGITLCKDCHLKCHKHIFIGRTKRKPDPRQMRLPIFE